MVHGLDSQVLRSRRGDEFYVVVGPVVNTNDITAGRFSDGSLNGGVA